MKTSVNYFFALLFSLILFACGEDQENPTIKDLVAVDYLDQSYGSNPIQNFDIFLPAGRSKEATPLLIYIHGGGWVEGSKAEFLQFKQALQKELPEYAMASINYRLFNFSTGANKFPSQENDVIEAIKFIISQTDEWNISNQIILAGASAGGHLALLHSYKHQNIGNIKGVIALFPPTDLSSYYAYNLTTTLGLNALLGGNPSDQATAYQNSSPSFFIRSSVVPTIIFHGTTDLVVPIWQSDLFTNKLKEASAKYEYYKIENQGHGFTNETYLKVFKDAATFIRTNVK